MYVHGGAIHDPRDPMIGFHAMPVVSGGISPNRFPLDQKVKWWPLVHPICSIELPAASLPAIERSPQGSLMWLGGSRREKKRRRRQNRRAEAAWVASAYLPQQPTDRRIPNYPADLMAWHTPPSLTPPPWRVTYSLLILGIKPLNKIRWK